SQYPNQFPVLTKGRGQEGAKDAGKRRRKIILGADVGNMERAALAHPGKHWPINTDLDTTYGYGTNMSPRNHTVPLAEPSLHVIEAPSPRGTLTDGVEGGRRVVG